MLWFLKTQDRADNTLSAARGIYVLTGLLGTWFAPWLEGQIGSIHCGAISLWYVIYTIDYMDAHLSHAKVGCRLSSTRYHIPSSFVDHQSACCICRVVHRRVHSFSSIYRLLIIVFQP